MPRPIPHAGQHYAGGALFAYARRMNASAPGLTRAQFKTLALAALGGALEFYDFVIFVFFACAAVFWAVFEQAGSTLSLFADRNTNRVVFGNSFPASWFQSLNAVFIVTFAGVFAWLWLTLGSRQPSAPTTWADIAF